MYGQLYSETLAAGGADAGDWFAVDSDGRTHLPVAISITGTATVQLEGRNLTTDTAVVIDTKTASGGVVAARYAQMRINVTSSTAGAVVAASIDAKLRTV